MSVKPWRGKFAIDKHRKIVPGVAYIYVLYIMILQSQININNFMLKTTLIFCLFFVSSFSYGQVKADTSRTNLNALCDRFMETFQTGKFSDAVQLLKINSTLGELFIDDLGRTVVEQMNNINANYKKITGYSLVEEKELKNILARRRYILKFELHFLTFDFYLYNNGSGWTISGFYYIDDQKGLF